MAKRVDELVAQLPGTRVTIMPGIYSELVQPDTHLDNEIRQLLATQFGRVQTSEGAPASYVEATTTAPEHTLSIAICQEHSDDAQTTTQRRFFRTFGRATSGPRSPSLLGTARVELAGATLVESMILLQPSSSSAQALAAGTAAEIASFAPVDGLSKALLLDVIDTIVAATLRIAHERGIERLWIFPRNGFMSLMRAEIPQLLPPYRFTLCQDVVGWNEESAQLRQFRAMRLRGLGRWPDIFEISRTQLAADLGRRREHLAQRHASRKDIEQLLPLAMLRAQRVLREEATAQHARVPAARRTVPPVTDYTNKVRQEAVRTMDSTNAPPPRRSGFLPFAGAASYEGQYLQDVVRRGGNAAVAYKELSRHLLELAPGQRVLDVGCGSGVDLAPLSAAVGPRGHVIGIDQDASRVHEARLALDTLDVRNVSVLLADVQQLTLPTGEFDRVRADRVVQHIDDHLAALAHMKRVLKPGGVLGVVEPDWATIAVAPATADSEDDDTTLTRILAWCRRHLRHPLIGRNLRGLLQGLGDHAWQDVVVTTQTYTFTDWSEVDTILQLSKAAQALRHEQPELTGEITSWLEAVEAASRRGTFFAAVPLFFATARKAG